MAPPVRHGRRDPARSPEAGDSMSDPIRIRTAEVGDQPIESDHDCGPAEWYSVPPRFFEDHEDRACVKHADVEVHEFKTVTKLWLHPCDASELMSDAEFYGSSSAEFDATLFGVCVSAAATVRRLEKQGVLRNWPNWSVMK